MHHPGERGQLPADSIEQFGNLGLLADIGCEDVDAALVVLGDVLDDPLRACVRSTPTGQHDVTGSELGQIRRRMQADRTESAGDQIAPVSPRLQRIRQLHHDLADVARLLHTAERGPGLGNRIDLGGQWRPLAPGQSPRHLGQQVTNTLGVRPGHHVQRHDLVGDVGAGFRHLLMRPDFAFSDLGEAAILGGGPHSRFEEPFIGQAVEHHIDT